jgi:hypothetical protein
MRVLRRRLKRSDISLPVDQWNVEMTRHSETEGELKRCTKGCPIYGVNGCSTPS